MFPEITRVVYKINPLDNVICQLRFPPILKIDTEVPSDFQDKIRSYYPSLSESSELTFETSPNIEEQMPADAIKQMLKSPGIKNYEFSSEDGKWKVNLTRNFMSLSTKQYHRWEEFKEKLQLPLETLVSIYSPSYFTRVGLRYVDVIRRSKLGLADIDWKELINEHILGLLAVSGVGEAARGFQSIYEVKLEDSNIRISTRTVKSIDSDEVCFMIDSDFFNTNKLELEEALKKLDFFNNHASRLIRWCIKDRLHKAMEPQEL